MYCAYDKIESGLAGHAIRDLTGAPYEYLNRDRDVELEAETTWKFL